MRRFALIAAAFCATASTSLFAQALSAPAAPKAPAANKSEAATTTKPVLIPERTVKDNVVTSKRDPAINITVPKAATYIGAARWLLHDVADAELHVFVEADEKRRIKRYFWIHFEGYLPSKPDYFYEYKHGKQMRVHGLDMDVRARFGPTSEKPEPGSDYERVVKLITDAGYTLPAHIINVRFVHILDAARRKELMIIYTEDMAPTGLTSEDLIVDGKVDLKKWGAVEPALTSRAINSLQISQ